MKTTAKQFDQFKNHVYKWQRDLGLDQWTIYFRHKKLEGSFAETTSNSVDLVAVIEFNTVFEDRDADDANLNELALHETLHILTAPLDSIARSRYVTPDEVGAAEHAIVRTLQNYIMRKTQ